MNGTMRTKLQLAGISASLLAVPLWTAGAVLTAAVSVPAMGAAQSLPSQASRYADGVYTATGQYGGEPSFITVTVTLSGGVITATNVTTHATNPTSLGLQRRFAAAVPAVVVGRPIDQVNVGRLAGSSGTPRGFNAAIEQIRQQAAR